MKNLPKFPLTAWLLFLAATAALFVSGCDSPSYSNIYGPDYSSTTYNGYYGGPGFYDPWYGGGYYGGGVVVVGPPHRPVHPIAPMPRPMPR